MEKRKSYLSLLGVFAIFLMFVGCVSNAGGNVETNNGPIKVEMESGVIEGNIVMNVGPDKEKDGEIASSSGDMLYMQDSGSISVEFNLPKSGDYIVKIYYALPDSYGTKENNVIINGEDLGALGFPITQGKWAAKWIQSSLQEGVNTLSVAHNWGYTWFDYVTIEPIN